MKIAKILTASIFIAISFFLFCDRSVLGASEPTLKQRPTIDIRSLTTRVSSDGSMYLLAPQDWAVGGGNYAFAATSPDEKMGVTATNDGSPGMTNTYDYLMNRFLPLGRNTNTVIHKREPNYEMMRFSQSQGYSSVAENFIGETTQVTGQRVRFFIMVNVASMPAYGMGFVNTVGFYATPELFDRNAEVLYKIAESISPNRDVIMGRQRENLNRLNQASKTMSETGDVVIQGLRSSTANKDRAMDKYNYYSSGEEARYSAEEDRIYVGPSNQPNYATNPNNPGEMLTDVPDDKWDKLEHERDF